MVVPLDVGTIQSRENIEDAVMYRQLYDLLQSLLVTWGKGMKPFRQVLESLLWPCADGPLQAPHDAAHVKVVELLDSSYKRSLRHDVGLKV
jgi:hypothetical protein